MRFEKRNREIVRMRCEDRWTLQEIANRFKLTRERVRQILERHGITCTAFKSLDHRTKRVTVPCLICGVGVETVPSKSLRRPFCSEGCKLDYYHPQITCDQCGKQFRRRRGVVERNKTDRRYKGKNFCSESCYRVSRRKVRIDAPGLARFHLREYLRYAGMTSQELKRVSINV